MIEAMGITVTDGVNRKNHVITTEALLHAYKKTWEYGLPSNLSHDSTKLIGWTFLSGMYFEPGMAYVTNKFYQPQNEEELQQLKMYSAFYHSKVYYAERSEEYEKLKSLLGETLTPNARKVLTYNAVCFEDKNIVLRAIPELAEKIVDGMISLKDLKSFVPGAYEFGEYVVFAHRLFRRSGSLLNWINRDFITRFVNIAEDNLNIKIALDMDVIALKDSVQDESEYEYWWGPKFDNDLSKIPTGVTRHINKHYDEVFSNIEFTDFYWHKQDAAQTFECEELSWRPISCGDKEYYNCRYVHSRLDSVDGKVIHLDGAVRSYTPEQMILRSEQNLDHVSHDSVYKKLWRIDGEISVALWKELITHYFRDNMLVGEYFCGEDDKFEQILIEEQKDKPKKDTVQNYLPCNMEQGNGLRFFFSIKKNDKGKNKKRKKLVSIKDIQVVTLDGGKNYVPFIESDTITLLKLVKRNGAVVKTSNISRIAFEDLIINFPILKCSSCEAASIVLLSLKQLCNAFKQNVDDRLISFSLDVAGCIEERVFLSFAGHVNDFVELFNIVGTEFPRAEELDEWILRLYATNTTLAKDLTKNLKVYDLLNRNGNLFFERVWLADKYKMMIELKGESLIYNMRMTQDELDKISRMHLKVAPIYLINKTICEKCGKEYKKCKCIKFIDDAGEKVTAYKLIGAFWTNRHSYDGMI